MRDGWYKLAGMSSIASLAVGGIALHNSSYAPLSWQAGKLVVKTLTAAVVFMTAAETNHSGNKTASNSALTVVQLGIAVLNFGFVAVRAAFTG